MRGVFCTLSRELYLLESLNYAMPERSRRAGANDLYSCPGHISWSLFLSLLAMIGRQGCAQPISSESHQVSKLDAANPVNITLQKKTNLYSGS
jgi:hypothetical protein